MKIDHNYLREQFSQVDAVLDGIRDIVRRGDFTLGREVGLFEAEFARMVGVKHAVGVGNGTDAIFLALKSIGVKRGVGEVITTPYSFYATTAMIQHAGAVPVFADVGRDFNIDPQKIEEAITPHTVGIVPVHWAGRPCNMNAILAIAKQHGLWVVEDCAHAPDSVYHGSRCGSFGAVNTFSLHPLKNVNVWGDGGVVTTNDDAKAECLKRLRNHGMTDRNTCEAWGYNSRLDTVQAVVARFVLSGIKETTRKRRENARTLTNLLTDIPEIEIVPEAEGVESNYYLYSFHADRRDALQTFLRDHGVDAKVHYPVPLHLQPAAKSLGHKRGDFPNAEWCADSTLSLPVHEWVSEGQLGRMASLVRQFYEAV